MVLLYLRMHRIPCALGCGAYLSVWQEEEVFCVECLVVFPSLSPSTFHCLSVWRVPVFSWVWGLMAGWSGFAIHWCSLHLGTCCQYWKLQHVSGTQPPPPHTGGSVGWASGCHTGGREFDAGQTITQGLKITEEKVLPLQCHLHMVRLSSLLG